MSTEPDNARLAAILEGRVTDELVDHLTMRDPKFRVGDHTFRLAYEGEVPVEVHEDTLVLIEPVTGGPVRDRDLGVAAQARARDTGADGGPEPAGARRCGGTPMSTDQSETARPCSCWAAGASLHDGHCCFGRLPGESYEEWDARFDRIADGTQQMCHTRPAAVSS